MSRASASTWFVFLRFFGLLLFCEALLAASVSEVLVELTLVALYTLSLKASIRAASRLVFAFLGFLSLLPGGLPLGLLALGVSWLLRLGLLFLLPGGLPLGLFSLDLPLAGLSSVWSSSDEFSTELLSVSCSFSVESAVLDRVTFLSP